MRRIYFALLSLALCASLALPTFAAEGEKVSVSQYHGRIIVDGKEAEPQLDKDSSRSPLVCDGTLYIPFMAAGQWLGADVSYNETAGVVTIAHNGKKPVFHTQSELREMEIIWDDWEGLEYPDKPQEAQLLDKVMFVVDGIPRDFFNARGGVFRPLQFGGYVLFPLEVVSELMGKRMTEFPDDFANYVYLYTAPTQEELNETDAYLAAVRGHLDAVRAIVKGAAPETGEEYAAKVRQMQEHLKAVWTLPEPVFDCMKPFAERLRYQAGLVLWQHIDSRLPLEENSGARPTEDAGPVRPASWTQVTGSDGKTWYEPGPTLAEVELDPKDWADFAQQMITEEAGVTTYFLGLEKACANSEAFLAEVKSDSIGAAAFRDAADITYWEAVATLTQLGIINGKDGGTVFDPTGNVTRAEAAKMITIIKCGGEDAFNAFIAEGAEFKSDFSDIQDNWARPYIRYCADMGIINGRGDGTFDPEAHITANELCKMALAMLGYDSETYDLMGASWAEQTDRLARICNPSPYSGFHSLELNEAISRENAAQLLYNALGNQTRCVVPAVDENTGKMVWKNVGTTNTDGTPRTLLKERFDLYEFPAVPAQPTV